MGQCLKGESIVRAYLLTDDPHFLLEREIASKRVSRDLDNLDRLVGDNAEQKATAITVREYVQKRVDYAAKIITLNRMNKLEENETRRRVRESAAMTSALIKRLHLMRDKENDLLQIRQAEFDAAIDRANSVESALALASILALTLAALMTYRYFTEKTQLDKRYRAIFDHTYQFMGLLTTDGRIVEANQTALRLVGADQSQIKGTRFVDTPWWNDNPEGKRLVEEGIKKAAKGQFVRFETVHTSKDGEVMAIDFSLKPVFDKNGEVTYLLPEGRDMTEQKLIQMRISESESRVQAILTCLAEGICQLDVDGRIVYINSAAQQILQYEEAELIGQFMHEKVHHVMPDGSIRDKENCPLLRVIKEGKSCRVSEDWFVRKDDSFVPVEYVSSPLVLDGKNNGAVLAFQDITMRKEAENRVSEFYSTVSHELRTPLTSIRGALRLMEAGKGGELSTRGKQLISMGRQECDRLVRLVNDILDIRKLEAGKLELSLAKANIKTLIDRSIENLRPLAEEHRVKLSAVGILNLELACDKDRVTQILTNLFSNAIKFSPEDGTVTVSMSVKDNFLKIMVCDTGAGISPANQKKLFRVFQQVDSSDSRPKGGTGLGLAICKALVEQHGGQVGVESKEGEGSTFWFTLPMDTVSMEVPAIKDMLLAHNASEERPKVVIAEDDDFTRHLLTQQLTKAGLICISAQTGEDTLEILRKQQADLLFLDLGLPDMDGVKVIEELKERGRGNIPLIVYTARDLNATQKAGTTLGTTRHLTKSLATEEQILEAVNEVLQGRWRLDLKGEMKNG